MSLIESLGASFRDPSGFLYRREGILYRQVNLDYREQYKQLMQSGLYDNLVQTNMLISHQEVEVEPVEAALAYKVLKPQEVQFISYPYEWCFSQLKKAALTTLEIEKRALKFGMTLKDSSAYNIQFQRGHPVLIDTLSFDHYQDGKPWDAYRQFCQHFLSPLSLMALRDVRLSQLLRVHMDGIPLDLASKLLPRSSYLNFSLLSHIHLHAAAQRRYAGKAVIQEAGGRTMSKTAFLALLDNLETGVRSLRWNPTGTAWGDYYEETNYTQLGMEHKKQLIGEFLDEIRPKTLWDLGANLGLFSRVASGKGIPTLAFDVDMGAVEQNYLACLEKQETDLLPLLLDLTNPSPAIGWQNHERLSFLERAPADAAMALALVHHLAITNNLPLPHLAEFFHRLGRWLIIEFVPKTDSQVQRLLVSRQDIFPDYNVETFESVFAQRFKILRSATIHDSQRRIYLMERH
jgi:ribosomal protein L11 methylase PrmA